MLVTVGLGINATPQNWQSERFHTELELDDSTALMNNNEWDSLVPAGHLRCTMNIWGETLCVYPYVKNRCATERCIALRYIVTEKTMKKLCSRTVSK